MLLARTFVYSIIDEGNGAVLSKTPEGNGHGQSQIGLTKMSLLLKMKIVVKRLLRKMKKDNSEQGPI